MAPGADRAYARTYPAPAACVVGEPTSMRIAVAHKGTQAFRVCASGTPGHSSLAPHLLNPIYPMAELALALRDASQHFRMHGPRDAGFEVPHTTVHVGRMQGGEQVNIVPMRHGRRDPPSARQRHRGSASSLAR